MKKSSSQIMIVLGIAVVTAIGFAGMYIMRPTAPVEKLEDRIEKLEVINAKQTDYFPSIKTQAVVESRFNITLHSQVLGQIVYISPKFLAGGYFDTDEVILKIDPSDYELALAQAEVNVARAEQTLSFESEQADLAKKDWDKYGVGEPTDLVLRIPQLKEAEAGLRGAHANYEAQRIRLERTEVKAPYPLMIATKQVDLGQIVGNNQALATIFGTEEAEIRMPLSQKQMDLLSATKVGILEESEYLDVKVRDLTREGDIVWDAKIKRIESNIDRMSRVYFAVATIDDPMNIKTDKATPPLLPGVFVDLEVIGKKTENVYRVPAKAMRDDNNIYYYEDEKLLTKPVEVLDRDQEIVTIISGISNEDKIVTSPPFSYVPGMKSAIASIDGIPVAGPGGPGGRPGGGGRPAAAPAAQPASSTAAAAAEMPAAATQEANAEGGRPNFANMTPEQRRAAVANMTPEQRQALQARRAARQAAGGGQGGRPQGAN